MGVSMYVCFTLRLVLLKICGSVEACSGWRHLMCRAGVSDDAWLMMFLVDSAMHLYAISCGGCEDAPSYYWVLCGLPMLWSLDGRPSQGSDGGELKYWKISSRRGFLV
jgi:hypothetical protein